MGARMCRRARGGGECFRHGAAAARCEQWRRDAEGCSGGAGERSAIWSEFQVVPGRLDVLKWPLLVGFAFLFALGAFALARKPVAAATVPAGRECGGDRSSAAAAAPTNAAAGKTLAGVDAAVGNSLDSLKDQTLPAGIAAAGRDDFRRRVRAGTSARGKSACAIWCEAERCISADKYALREAA